jgi:DNA-binding response OmpR family regulator
MDGIELQRRIRIERPQLPVIFISAHYDDETRQRALDAGAVAFLYKPFDAAELLGTIETVLNNAREVKQAISDLARGTPGAGAPKA